MYTDNTPVFLTVVLTVLYTIMAPSDKVITFSEIACISVEGIARFSVEKHVLWQKIHVLDRKVKKNTYFGGNNMWPYKHYFLFDWRQSLPVYRIHTYLSNGVNYNSLHHHGAEQ